MCALLLDEFSFQVALYLLVKQKENLTFHQVSLRALLPACLQFVDVFVVCIILSFCICEYVVLIVDGAEKQPSFIPPFNAKASKAADVYNFDDSILFHVCLIYTNPSNNSE